MQHEYKMLGKDIVDMHAESRWGSKFYNNLSKDLASAMPEIKSFSTTNLKYMTYFYQLYSGIRPQAVDELKKEMLDENICLRLEKQSNI